ncbi:translation initiation factor eIF-2B subunit epsilon-like [Corticium candelabrum]|uniref:translation initiation factor eIF-2B subunit epsilon-like n=1 Tax=Corticium candelabrum TaxID=121492 RepID=UPI002E2599D8|nr:translation initiation factor eIF-2B subunit epsilon-like [Corticium candelabrum]
MSKERVGKKVTSEKWGTENPLQAVVLADSFNYRFLPITLEKPRALLPLVNTLLIDYSLQFLSSGGVEQAFVFCCAHADQIRTHLQHSKWTKSNSPLEVQTIISEGCLSTGDALREIDSRSLIKSDFVLVSGDLVSNMDLEKAVREHKERRQTIKDSVMTMIFMAASPGHRTRCYQDDLVVAINPASKGRLLHWQRTKRQTRLHFPLDLFSGNAAVELRYDLLDCHMSICSPQVPQLFTDNFDYQDQDDFVRGILVSEEIMGNQIHTHIVKDEYAARVSNLHSYDAISKDVIHRWTYPLVPDVRQEERQGAYSYSRRNVYLHNTVKLARDCHLEQDVVVGQESSVGNGTTIVSSVIGQRCRIGSNVCLNGAHIWNDVVIGDNVGIKKSILCDHVNVEAGAKIPEGCIICFGVIIGSDCKLKPGSKVTLMKSRDETIQACGLGDGSLGFLWSSSSSKQEDGTDVIDEVWPADATRCDSESSDSSSDASSRCISPNAIQLGGEAGDADHNVFYLEVVESIRNGIAERVSVDNMILEVNSSKHAYNIAISDVPASILRAILSGPQQAKHNHQTPKELLTYSREALEYLSPLLQNYVKSLESQLQLIQSLEELAFSNETVSVVFMGILRSLYDSDIIEEVAITKWNASPVDSGNKDTYQHHERMKKQAQPFLLWLEQAEEESSSDE